MGTRYKSFDSITIFILLSDDSGGWGKGGLFTAVSSRSSLPEQQYTLAGKMQGNVTLVVILSILKELLEEC